RHQKISLLAHRVGAPIAGALSVLIPAYILVLFNRDFYFIPPLVIGLATLIFALVMALRSRASEKDLLAATAAYASVLVTYNYGSYGWKLRSYHDQINVCFR